MNDSWISSHDKGTLIRLHIQPGAACSELAGLHGTRLKIRIKAPPKEGEANEELVRFLAEVLDLAKAKVHLIRGNSSRQKDVIVEVSIEFAKLRLIKP